MCNVNIVGNTKLLLLLDIKHWVTTSSNTNKNQFWGFCDILI